MIRRLKMTYLISAMALCLGRQLSGDVLVDQAAADFD